MDNQNRAQDESRQARAGAGDAVAAFVSADGAVASGGDDEALAKLTEALRAGLPGSGRGPDLLTGQMPADADPFEFFASGTVDATVEHTQDLPREMLSGGSDDVARRVALMAQDMAAFGVFGREAPLRLDPPGEALRHEYFA